jgi:integrase
LKACPAYLRNLVLFYLDTGARHDEGVSLTWDRVNLVKEGRSSVTFTNTKNGKVRTVPLPMRTAALFKRLRPKDTRKQPRVFLWTPPGEKKAVPFSDPKKSWETARTAAKLVGLRIHDLRHTYASKLIKRRVPLYEVSKLMGHSSIRMTERYAHLVQEQLESAVAVLDQAA